MNTVSKIVLAAMVGLMFSLPALAENKTSVESLTAVMAHIDQAIIDNGASDFASSSLHLKAARAAAEFITADAAIVKQANEKVIAGQIQAKQGMFKQSTELLNQSLVLYKSL